MNESADNGAGRMNGAVMDVSTPGVTIHASHLGYPPNSRKWAVIRANSELPEADRVCAQLSRIDPASSPEKFPLTKWGNLWGACWYLADFSPLTAPGSYIISVADSAGNIAPKTRINVLSGSLFAELYRKVALEQLEERATAEKIHRKPGGGLADSGGPLREFGSHAVTALALEDALTSGLLDAKSDGYRRTLAMLENILKYLIYCGNDDGSFRHEGYPPCQNLFGPTDRVVACDAMLAVVCFTRAGALFPGKSDVYLRRALQAWKWLMAKEPGGYVDSEIHFQGDWARNAGYNLMARVLGQKDDFEPPRQFRARDYMLLSWGAYCLWTATQDSRFANAGFSFLEKLARLQTGKDRLVDGLYGDFLMWPDREIRQSGFEHAGFGYHVSAMLPDCLRGCLGFLSDFPAHPRAKAWKDILVNYVYGYLLPAAERNPFGLLPHGIGPDGLNFFKYIWHGCNCMYLFAGAQAVKLGAALNEPRLRPLAEAQAQWILGINPGRFDPAAKSHASINMLIGLDDRSLGGWAHNNAGKIAWSISNGFSAHRQFQIDPLDQDGPNIFTDEDWISHGAGFISLISELASAETAK